MSKQVLFISEFSFHKKALCKAAGPLDSPIVKNSASPSSFTCKCTHYALFTNNFCGAFLER